MKMIVTRPQHDVITKYLSVWTEEVINFAKEKGIEVFDLIKEKANKKDFCRRVKKLQPDMIFLNGHGDDNCVTGHDDQEIVRAGDNHNILYGAITYALSCNSGKILGPKVTKNKATTYIGYEDKFIFVSDRNYMHSPIDDPRARPFMEASNQVMISLLKGHRAGEASKKSKNKFKEHFMKLSSSQADPDSLQAAQCLWWNMRNQVCLGNLDAKLNV
ncbi:hypothetical protein KKA93_02030 [Patescibacteria group bacterium]|nr:hypothetical protein [Patescibacteria group bacterium]MBU1663363.1 hypothetical protein [Patescibacteria group bacterium]MBU1934348.1 hypothetical protein [Patescibacteria group bacterium]MBU2007605.1 hypothetical protein [Patescibacteria group bacterium]MBU2233386.1 hypothetical protein [Patescibacteria group bacterium]